MDLATAALRSLLPKLAELIHGEYKLQKGVKKDVQFLEREMTSIDAALRKVAMVPHDKLDDNSKIWANQVRELSYEMEDVVESFLVGVQGFEPAANPDGFKGFVKKVANLFTKGKARHQIANAIKSIKDQVQEVADRRDRYKIDDLQASLAATTMVDPRLMAQFKDHKELVGIEGPRDELIKRLVDEDDCESKQQLKILSIFGFGGVGKTTLARAVYDKIQAQFVCKAFFSVGQNPNLKNVLIGILLRLDKDTCSNPTMLDDVLLIEKLRGLLGNKRYLIIIDDIWDMSSWDIIKCAFIDSKCESRVIITTRIFEVAKEASDIYKQEPLSPGRSKELFCMRLSIGKSKSPYHESVKISEKILQKCGGIPLAIITIASLLASKPVTDWPGVYDSIGFGNEDNKEVDTTRKILLYSYYDLPYYPRLCLLHLGIYPEDFEIRKDNLIWKWVAEGYVHEEPGKGLFEVGERYFNLLIDRSMIQAVEKPYYSIIYACHVHDLVLDMIHFLSEDEGFVTASNSNRTSLCITARRLAINSEAIEQNGYVANSSMQQVRSYNATMCQFSMLPLLSNFKALRVLALEECTFMGSEQFSMKPEDSPYHLKHLGRLIHIRYLGISDQLESLEVPEEIGDLRFLQVLDLGRSGIKKLPQSVGRLTQLKCLHFGGSSMGVLDWTNLTSLEALQLHHVSPDFLKELGKLKELRELNLYFEEDDNMLFKDLVGRVANLQKLQVIRVTCWYQEDPELWSDYAGPVALGHLRHLTLHVLLPVLPVWINSSCLPNLCHLDMNLIAMESQDMEILGWFSELITLCIRCDDGVVFPDTMEEGAFPKLRYLNLENSDQPRFVRGAMSSLEYIEFIGLVPTYGLDFHSLVNLPRLEKVDVEIDGKTAMGIDVLQAHASLKQAVEIHPNHPALNVRTDIIRAMDLATVAMGSLLPKLFELLHGEYKLQMGVKKDVEFLEREMRSIDAALRKVAMVPRDKLDDNSKIWAGDVRELAYEMEDVVERFMVGVHGFEPAANQDSFKGFVKKVSNLFTEGKTRHQIANAIKAIKDQIQEVTDQRDWYKIDDVEASLAATTIVDPRLMAQFKDQRELVGIEEPRDELIKRLANGDDFVSKQQLKILSIFGSGGLGKTTLAKAVYNKLQTEFECKAFYLVGQNPNLENVLMGIFSQVDKASCSNATILDVRLLIIKLRELLVNKRYLIVIDDIWDMGLWDLIKCAFIDSKCGSRVITTTRIYEVAKAARDIYCLEALSPGKSKELFSLRLSVGKSKNPCDPPVKISEKILQKCGGIPLAIITIASLLASKPVTDWSEVYDSIGFGNEDNQEVYNTRKILLHSYYDLPYYPRICLLHLSIYPEYYEIDKDILIWKWVAEGYVPEEPGKGLFEVGERYFNMLIDRSMIQAVEYPYHSIIYACRVHDLVLDMIHFVSKEESAVTFVKSNRKLTSSHSTTRRLAIQNEQDGSVANMSMHQVRSYNATMCHFSMLPLLSNFKALRVLALEECTFMGSEQFSMKPEDSPYHLKHLERLIHLRYLGISDQLESLEVPEEIGDLRFLQVLDLGRSGIKKLPQSVGRLTQLKCLRFPGSSMEVLDCTNLTSLEELKLHTVSTDFLKGLGKLKEMRVFEVLFEEHDNMLFKDLMGNLANLQKLQVIMVDCWSRDCKQWSGYAGSVALGHLRHLTVHGLLPGLPVWINTSCLPNLCHLNMKLKAMEPQDMEILGRFSELITLRIRCKDGAVFPDTMEEGAFPKLRYLELENSNQPRFVRGAMSSLECFEFIGLVGTNGLDFHSLMNLPRLEKVDAEIEGKTGMDTDVQQARASLKHAVEIHPNHPTLNIRGRQMDD
ncbi:unnamed protein product [Triticum turgidum subsp. durum]|uniref:AAA+ ATPase domain-containing protein n=1 Tax=Triticum turgidum subsp. durum TaxID=4567 RepID=A0A9R0ZMH8_TRITD|nr:unnamed protein product [Triticum turgidum subsp. durum]